VVQARRLDSGGIYQGKFHTHNEGDLAVLKADPSSPVIALPLAGAAEKLEDAFKGRVKGPLERLLPRYLEGCRWFAGRAFRIKSAQIIEILSMAGGNAQSRILLIQVDYVEEDSEIYVLPLVFKIAEEIDVIIRNHPRAAVARLTLKGKDGLLCDAVVDREFCKDLFNAVVRRRRMNGFKGELVAAPMRGLRKELDGEEGSLEPSLLNTEQRNTSIVYGERFILNIFRRLYSGVNPDLEIGRFLTRKGFASIPPVAGSIEYRKGRDGMSTLAVLKDYIPNQGDAWTHTMDVLDRFFEALLAQPLERRVAVPPVHAFLDLVNEDPPVETMDLIGPYLETARLLGERTGELHATLAGAEDEPELTAALYWYITRAEIVARWGDVMGGIAYERARKALLMLEDEKCHPKNWRPTILALSGGAWSRFRLAEYACWLAAGRGVLSLGQIIIGEVEDRMERREQAEKLLRKFIREQDLDAFPVVVVEQDMSEAIKAILQSHGIGGIRPNAVLLGWSQDPKRRQDFCETLRLAEDFRSVSSS